MMFPFYFYPHTLSGNTLQWWWVCMYGGLTAAALIASALSLSPGRCDWAGPAEEEEERKRTDRTRWERTQTAAEELFIAAIGTEEVKYVWTRCTAPNKTKWKHGSFLFLSVCRKQPSSSGSIRQLQNILWQKGKDWSSPHSAGSTCMRNHLNGDYCVHGGNSGAMMLTREREKGNDIQP